MVVAWATVWAIAAAALAVVGIGLYLHYHNRETTDDAQVVPISA